MTIHLAFGRDGRGAADLVLADYHQEAPLDEARLRTLIDALRNPESPELRAVLQIVCDQGDRAIWSQEAKQFVQTALANDSARFLSEAVERGCVAASLSGRLRQGPLADGRFFAVWQACENVTRTYRPLEHGFDEAGLDRVLRAQTLAVEDSGASGVFRQLRQQWAAQIAPPATVEPGGAREGLFKRLIARLERMEAITRTEWRYRGFEYEDYALLSGLRTAADVNAPSQALRRLAAERESREQRRGALFAEVLPEWRPLLLALLDDANARAKPLEHDAYKMLIALPRPKLGLAFHDILRLTADDARTKKLDELFGNETGVVGKTYAQASQALLILKVDLETRRIELDDARMADVLAHAPKRSTKLLASVEWTLAQGPAPRTRAALTATVKELAGNRYHRAWPARIAAIRAKHPDPAPPPFVSVPMPEEGPRRPELDGFATGLVNALFAVARVLRPNDRALNPLAPLPERYRALAGAEADLRTPQWNHSDDRARAFYTGLLGIPERLDALWMALHVHSYTLDGKAQPSAGWLTAARAIVAEHGPDRHGELLGRVLELTDPPPDSTLMGLNTVRALIYLAIDRPAQSVAPAIADFALRRCFVTVPGRGIKAERLGNACLWALINLPDGGGVPYLARLLTRVKYPKVRKKINAALDEAARKAGLSRGALDELSVPTHGLDSAGECEVGVGDGRATLHATIDGATVSWTSPGGKALKSASTAMRADKAAMAAVRTLAKEMDADLAAQTIRLQRLYLEDRGWTAATWRERHLEHPLIRPFAARLIWWAERDGSRTAFLPREGVAEDVAGGSVSLDQAHVRLWHPIEAEVEDVLAWRDRLEMLELRQPFAQAWREIYRLTDAERTTGTYTNRWAGHILKQHQAMTLARLNGWTVTHRMWVDAANSEPWHLLLPTQDLVAEYWVEGAGGEDPEVLESQAYVYVATDRVMFHRTAPGATDSARGPARGEAAALASVPPVTFSEVMRHADLLKGVASIASDPQWVDGGREAAHPNQWRQQAEDYWANAAWATLTVSGETRRALLERILPKLAIADRCSWEKNALVVRGERHSYRIHLGSAAVQITKTSRHLCIVPIAEKDSRVRLPFAGDRVLSIILSKALLLAADDKIDDPVILRQL